MSDNLNMVAFNEATQTKTGTKFGLTYQSEEENQIEVYFLSTKNKTKKLLSGFFNQEDVEYIPMKSAMHLKKEMSFEGIKINKVFVDFETQMSYNVSQGFVDQLQDYADFIDKTNGLIPYELNEEIHQFFDSYEQYATATLHLFLELKKFIKENTDNEFIHFYEELYKGYKEVLITLNEGAKIYNDIYEEEDANLFDPKLLY